MSNTFLVKKDKYQIIKVANNHYKNILVIENNLLVMEKIIGFNLIQLMYQVNAQNYEQIKLDILSPTYADLYLLVKPMFKELGILQRYGAFSVKRLEHPENNTSSFVALRNNEVLSKYHNFSLKCEQLGMHTVTMDCKIISTHKMIITQDIFFDDPKMNNPLIEKAFTLVMKDNIKKFIAFIEAIH